MKNLGLNFLGSKNWSGQKFIVPVITKKSTSNAQRDKNVQRVIQKSSSANSRDHEKSRTLFHGNVDDKL